MRVLKFLAIAAAAATLAGCLGGGGGTAAAPELRGTAAIGAPLAGATVTLRGANGTELIVTAGPDGRFVFPDTSSVTAPAMLRAEGSSRTLFSFTATLPTTPGSNTVTNATPLTDAVTRTVMGPDAAVFFNSFNQPAELNLITLNLYKNQLHAFLAPQLAAVGATGYNLFTSSFDADQTGLDLLLYVVSLRFKDGELAVANKTGDGNEVFVTIPKAGDLPAPLPENQVVDWDLTGIQPFIARFNDANDDARRAFFHADFLHDAQRIASAITGLRGSRVEQVAIDGCRVATSGAETCTIRGLLVNPATIDNPFIIDLRRDVNEWRIFGNQSQTATRPTVTAPTAAAVATENFNFDLPSAPINAILQGNLNGNMAFRMVQFDGSTHTVQAAVGSTLFHSRMAFGGLPGNLGNLVVDTDRLFHGLNSDIVQFTTTLSNAPISVMPDGAGNAIVGCPSGYTLQSTVVLLSHNLRRVTLAEALAGPNNIADQTFDLIDCTAEKIGAASSGHQEWHRVNADGSLSYGNLFAGPALDQYGQTAEEFADMLSPAGFQGNDTGGSWHDRAQIYELVIGGHRMFFILRHAVEWDGALSTANTPSRQYVELLIPR